MKKVILFLGVLSFITIVSCKKKEETVITPPLPPTIENTATPMEPNTEDQKDGTSIKVSTDGVDVNTKEGAAKTTISISNKEAAVEIKK